jgi:hypothetical protein
MRIEVGGEIVPRAGLFLTAVEASELRDILDDLLTSHVDDPAWHEHVSSADFQVELAVAPELPVH